jgi:C4-dicarboxylate transporter DctQ subunit
LSLIVYLYDRLIVMLALVASIMIAAVFVLIVVDVTMRTAGFRPPVFSSAISEYTLIYVTMLAAPWLVRERGHVRIDSFMIFIPTHLQIALERLLMLVCIALCLTAAWISADFAIDFWQKGSIDIRSIEIPRSLLFLPLTIGFGLCAMEFLRLLLIGQTLRPPPDLPADVPPGEI